MSLAWLGFVGAAGSDIAEVEVVKRFNIGVVEADFTSGSVPNSLITKMSLAWVSPSFAGNANFGFL